MHEQQGQHSEAGVADRRGRRGEGERPQLGAGPVPSNDQVDGGVSHHVGGDHGDEDGGPAPRLGRARPPQQLQDGQGHDALREPQREVHDQLDPRLTRVQQECGGLTQQARGDQHPRVHEEQPDHQRHLAEQEAVGLVAELQVEHQEATHGEHRRQQQQGDVGRSGRPRRRLEERDEGHAGQQDARQRDRAHGRAGRCGRASCHDDMRRTKRAPNRRAGAAPTSHRGS